MDRRTGLSMAIIVALAGMPAAAQTLRLPVDPFQNACRMPPSSPGCLGVPADKDARNMVEACRAEVDTFRRELGRWKDCQARAAADHVKRVEAEVERVDGELGRRWDCYSRRQGYCP